MALLHVFHSSIPFVKAIRGDGKELPFREGVYRTDDQKDIDFLNGMVADGHPHIALPVESERVVQSEMLNPLVALEARLREKILAELAAEQASGDLNRDLGVSSQEPLKPQNTVDVATATIGGVTLMQTPSTAASKLQSLRLATKTGQAAPASNTSEG